MEKLELEWNAPGLGKPLTETDIARLREKLSRLARNSRNAFNAYLLPMETKWARENLKNAHLEMVAERIAEDGRDWVIVAVDKETALFEKSKI